MFENIYKPSEYHIKNILWKDDPKAYDLELFALGTGHDQFLVVNPEVDEDLIHYVEEIPDTDKCVVWFHGDKWVAKLFHSEWEHNWNAYTEIEIVKPEYMWRKNPALDKLMTFEEDPFGSFDPGPFDCKYKLIWYMDPRVNPLDDKIWVMSCEPIGQEVEGTKDMGYLMPEIEVTFNEYLPNLNVDVSELYPPFYDLVYEYAWELDPAHGSDEPLWVVKFKPTYRKTNGWKWLGTYSPPMRVEYNEDLPQLQYDIDYVVPWFDLGYEHVWMLDNQRLKHGEEEIWAVKLCAVDEPEGTKFIDFTDPVPTVEFNPDLEGYEFDAGYIAPWYDLGYEHVWLVDPDYYSEHEDVWAVRKKYTDDVVGTKIMGIISPEQELEFNPALKNLYIEIDYKIPFRYRYYEHIWYVTVDGEKVWAAKLRATNDIIATKDMGIVEGTTPKRLDVVFISYGQPNAEENWQRVLDKAPYAKRVSDVDGILNAHKAAAELSETDMFYVVDGDAWVEDNWTFDFQPSLYDRDCVYVWQSENPLIGLQYGYGGVKLFPTALVKKTYRWGTDLTLSVGKKLKVMDDVSNITKINTSEFDTWRSAFRECAKLALKEDDDSQQRLAAWLKPNKKADYAKWAKLGAEEGVEYAESTPSISRVNDYEWLQQRFNDTHG